MSPTLAPVACVGTLLLDSVAVVDRLPGEDQRVESTATALVAGGNAANSAVTIARLGVEVDFVGVVGDDLLGRTAVAELAAEGVGTSGVHVDPRVQTSTSLVVVCTDTGTRTIVTRPAPPPPHLPTGHPWLHVDACGYVTLQRAGGSASRVSLDDGNPVPGLDLGLVDLYVPTVATLAVRYPGLDALDAARRARADGASAVVATAGAQGSFALSDSGTAFGPAASIVPVSTLGAGDVFHGALVAALVLGRDHAQAVRFANVTAALSCLALDGHSGVPDRATVEEHLAALPPGPADPVAAIRALHA